MESKQSVFDTFMFLCDVPGVDTSHVGRGEKDRAETPRQRRICFLSAPAHVRVASSEPFESVVWDLRPYKSELEW